MAQIIKNRRGSIGNAKDITTQNGEIVVASGSIGDLSGPFLLVGSPTLSDNGLSGVYKPASKIYTGNSVPTILSASYGNVLDGTPFYAVGSNTLYILSSAGNTTMNLAGNINGNTLTNLTASGSFSGSFQGDGGGLTNISASSIVGLNLSRISTGSVTASVDVGATTFQVASGSSNFFKIANSGIISITGSLGVTNGITGSLLGTASFADRATTSSYALSSSYSDTLGASLTSSANDQVRLLASNGATLSTITVNNVTSASYALSASYASFATTSSYVATSSYVPNLQEVSNKGATTTNALTMSGAFINGTTDINGDLNVKGTITYISSSTLQIGDNIIEINVNKTAGNSGMIVYDTSAPFTASLLWDASLDRWIAGPYTSESIIILASDTSSMSVNFARTASYSTTLGASLTSSANNQVRLLASDGSILSTLTVNNVTSASYALSASYSNTATSASYSLVATSASYSAVATSASYSATATSASYSLVATSASYSAVATSASYSAVATSASYAATASSADIFLVRNGLTVNSGAVITGSLRVTNGITGSLLGNVFGTASWANNATTASYSLQATSASYALQATTASYSLQATSASYASQATTASYALQATTASYALTASYVNTLFQNLSVTGSISTTNGIFDNSSGPGFHFMFMSSSNKISYISPATPGDLIQWNGTTMIASNLIDGGTF
jgi:hypothetical protein